MEFSSSGHFEAVHVIRVFHPEADVRVEFSEKTVSEMAGRHEFSFLSGKRAVVYLELHGDGRLGNLLERDWIRSIGGADRIPDGDI